MSNSSNDPEPSNEPPRRKILVVDDDELLLRGYQRSLSRSFQVFTASTVPEARRIAAQERPVLAIVDRNLGDPDGIDGIDLTRWMTEHDPGLRVALVTAYPTTDIVIDAARAGAVTVLGKPSTVAQILRRLDGEAPPELDRVSPATLARVAYEHMMRVVADCGGNITLAAQLLGIDRSTIHRKLKEPMPK